MNQKIRDQFPILNIQLNQNPLIYFDNGATTQKPQSVIDAVVDFYSSKNSNVHRSLNPLAESATVAYENARKKVSNFINANSVNEIIFTANTTESLNLIAKSWGRSNLKKGDKVILTILEHHANIVPWLQLKNEIGIEIEYIGLADNGKLDLDSAEKLFNDPKSKLLSIQHTSNSLGMVHDIEGFINLAKNNNLMVAVDAAQAMSHHKINVQEMRCDFLSFSGHKMYGPTGIGVLWAKREILESMPAWKGGGDMIHEVFTDHFSENDIPYKFEAGTPNIAGAIGLGAAIDFINILGWDKIQNHEQELTKYLFDQFRRLDFIKIHGNKDFLSHIPTIAFTIKNIHGHDIGDLLGERGICVRAGNHCTQPLHNALGVSSTSRASLGIYNTKEEIDKLITRLEEINKMFNE